MGRGPSKQPPKFRRHKASGQGIVTLGGKDFYLGDYNTPAARRRYAELLARYLLDRGAEGKSPNVLPAGGGETGNFSIAELLARYMAYAVEYYVQADGRPSSELSAVRVAVRGILAADGDLPPFKFGPLRLKALRQRWVNQGMTRVTINSMVSRAKRIFKWAVSEELIASEVFQALQAVVGLRAGKTAAPETKPVRPVEVGAIEAIKPHVAAEVWAMVRLQQFTGMRPGEVVTMRPKDIDTSGAVWIYTPEDHKNAWRGHGRQVVLGPKGQAFLPPS